MWSESVRGQKGCPTATAISPCTCSVNNDQQSISVNCIGLNNFTNSALDQVMTALVSPGVASLTSFQMEKTPNITKIPADVMSKFPNLTWTYFSQNQITQIPVGIFNYSNPTNTIVVGVSQNSIANVPSGAFNFAPNAALRHIQIEIANNQIPMNVSANAFNFPMNGPLPQNTLYLYNSQIQTIAPGAFNGIFKN